MDSFIDRHDMREHVDDWMKLMESVSNGMIAILGDACPPEPYKPGSVAVLSMALTMADKMRRNSKKLHRSNKEISEALVHVEGLAICLSDELELAENSDSAEVVPPEQKVTRLAARKLGSFIK